MPPGGLSLAGVVFDFDGTMALLNVDFARMRRHVRDHASGYGVDTDGLNHLYILEIIEKIYKTLADVQPQVAIQYRREAMGLVQEMELSAARESRLLYGVLDMLHSLADRGIRTGVVTRNCRDAVQEIFPDIQLHVHAVLTRDDLDHVKPDPEHLWQTLSLLEIPPERAAMVGDHPMDMALGIAVGAKAIGVLSGAADRGQLEASGASLILEKAPDILLHLA